jgi:hypothetical protein
VSGRRVVWDNDSPTKCECGFIGKVADFWVSEKELAEHRADCEVLKDAGDDDSVRVSLPTSGPH